MKVALIVLVFVAVAAANSYYKQPDYYHHPYYKFDWVVKAEDYYKQPLDYGQYEARDGYNTKGNYWVKLPGYSHIKTDYVVDAKPYKY